MRWKICVAIRHMLYAMGKRDAGTGTPAKEPTYERGRRNAALFFLRMNIMDEKTIKAIETAISSGFRVEILKDKAGNIIVQTIQRKRLKI